MLREYIDRLLSYPQRGQVQINFNLKEKAFRLSVPIFTHPRGLPEEVKNYVKKREDKTFKPHKTFFMMSRKKVELIQEIPFSLDFQETLRKKADEFWQMSQKCHRMLLEMAQEETYKAALFLDLPKGM